MVDVIARGEPALMLAHWTGIWFNGYEVGFNIFKEVVKRLHTHYDHLVWMKLSEVARYWAARELTRIGRNGPTVNFRAPFACPDFTVRSEAVVKSAPRFNAGGKVHGTEGGHRPAQTRHQHLVSRGATGDGLLCATKG
jgi:hypothetical protein